MEDILLLNTHTRHCVSLVMNMAASARLNSSSPEAEELTRKRNAISPVWDFFGFKKGNDGSPNEDGLPVCRLCMMTVSAKSSNTSNLFSHLKNNHPRQYAEIRSTSKSTSSGTNQAQPSIQEAIVSGQPYPKDSKRW